MKEYTVYRGIYTPTYAFHMFKSEGKKGNIAFGC